MPCARSRTFVGQEAVCDDRLAGVVRSCRRRGIREPLELEIEPARQAEEAGLHPVGIFLVPVLSCGGIAEEDRMAGRHGERSRGPRCRCGNCRAGSRPAGSPWPIRARWPDPPGSQRCPGREWPCFKGCLEIQDVPAQGAVVGIVGRGRRQHRSGRRILDWQHPGVDPETTPTSRQPYRRPAWVKVRPAAPS